MGKSNLLAGSEPQMECQGSLKSVFLQLCLTANSRCGCHPTTFFEILWTTFHPEHLFETFSTAGRAIFFSSKVVGSHRKLNRIPGSIDHVLPRFNQSKKSRLPSNHVSLIQPLHFCTFHQTPDSSEPHLVTTKHASEVCRFW